MRQMRTHTCNELRLEHVGQQVKIVGWMENKCIAETTAGSDQIAFIIISVGRARFI